MFDLKFRISLWGILVFILPMLINLFYFKVAPDNTSTPIPPQYRWIEWIEQATRILYMIFICILVSKQDVDFKSPYLYISIIFLILYYIVWIRFFMSGMQSELRKANFFFVPIPLAIFPVLYFLFAALWLQNGLAAITMLFFGVAHYFVSSMTL